MRHLLFGPATAGSRGTDAGLLILRLIGGLSLAFAHGMGKIPPAEQFVGMVGGMGFPAPALMAWAAALAEFAGGILLAIGLLTRPAALVVTIHFLVVFFHVHRADPFGDKEPALMFLMVALTLLFTGAGRYSVDALIGGPRDGVR